MQQYAKLQALIEDTFVINGNKQVHLMSHSLGGPYINLFLNTFVDFWWVRTYIASHILISPAMLGAPPSVFALVSGPQYDYVPDWIPKMLMMGILRTSPALLFMSPFANSAMWKGKTVIRTEGKNITTDGFAALWETLDQYNATDNLVASWEEVMQAQDAASPMYPDLPTLCLFANDTKTDVSMDIPDLFDGGATSLEWTWGDGTVPIDSLRHCTTASAAQSEEFIYGGSLSAHTSICSHPPLFLHICHESDVFQTLVWRRTSGSSYVMSSIPKS